jgi:hypothetical protein
MERKEKGEANREAGCMWQGRERNKKSKERRGRRRGKGKC